jgi:hypothetical protein
LAYVLSVRSLSPPKPAGLDPPNFRRHAPNWMWNRDSPKKIGKKNSRKIFRFFFFFFFLKTLLAEICKADLRVSQIRGTGKTRPYVRKLILHNNKFEFMAQSLFTSSSEVFLLEKRDIVKSVFLPGQVNFKIK